MIHIDSKITIWDRFSIDEEHKEALMEFLKENPDITASDITQWASDNGIEGEHSTLTDTGEELTPAENKGASTIEVVEDALGGIVWENAPVVPTITEKDLERYEQIAADTKKEFLYNKHTGRWGWCNRDDGGVPTSTGFHSRLAALLDAIEPYLNAGEED